MMTQELISRRILELCKAHNMSIADFRSTCRLSESVVDSILDGHEDISLNNIYEVCSTFEITMRDFFASELFK